MNAAEGLARKLADASRSGEAIKADALRMEELEVSDLAGAYAVQSAWPAAMGKSVRAWKVAKSPEGIPVAAPILDLHRAGARIASGSGVTGVCALEVEICYPFAVSPPVGHDAKRESVEAALGAPHLGIELIAFRLVERNKVPFPLFAADRLGNHSFLVGPEVPADIVSALAAGDTGVPVTIGRDGQIVYSAPAVHPAIDPVAPLADYLAHGCEAGPMGADQIATTGSLCGVVAIDGPGLFEIGLGSVRVEFILT